MSFDQVNLLSTPRGWQLFHNNPRYIQIQHTQQSQVWHTGCDSVDRNTGRIAVTVSPGKGVRNLQSNKQKHAKTRFSPKGKCKALGLLLIVEYVTRHVTMQGVPVSAVRWKRQRQHKDKDGHCFVIGRSTTTLSHTLSVHLWVVASLCTNNVLEMTCVV